MKLFVWDLHGTLEQGNEIAVVKLSNSILDRYGYKERFSEVMGKTLYGLKWYQYFEHLLPYESHEKHVELQVACFDYSNSKDGTKLIASHIKPSSYALDVLEVIQKKHSQIVISNTVPESLPMFLKALGMLDFFEEGAAIAVNQHTREAKRTKIHALQEYLSGKKYDEIIVIGDSESDMDLAHEAKAKAYLYAHNGTPFKSKRGHARIQDLREVLVEL